MMTTANSNEDSLLVAIDVAKRARDVLIRWPSGRSQTFRFANRREDFERLTAFLVEQGLPVRVALEATADFHRCIAHWLLRHGCEVHLASSVACARVREVLFNSWDKHDRKDAKVILYLLEHDLTSPWSPAILTCRRSPTPTARSPWCAHAATTAWSITRCRSSSRR